MIRYFAGGAVLLALGGCDILQLLGDGHDYRQWSSSEDVDPEFTCGYEVTTGVQPLGGGKYKAWAELTNVSGEKGHAFQVDVEIGTATITRSEGGEFEVAEEGYRVTEPASLTRKGIRVGRSHTFGFAGEGDPGTVKAKIVSINGEICDADAPQVAVAANQEFFTAAGTLILTAEASDAAGIDRVVFEQDGQVIGEAAQPPYMLEVAISEALNGRHHFTATAIDHAGNQTTTDAARVLVAIDNRFLGTAPGSDADFAAMGGYFNQLTPEDASKWGVAEPTRDQMQWEGLDKAYTFAREHGMVFKLHTLVWGQQQPTWIAALPPEEQLEELEEWMAELAARYPDVEQIDVVNEPLHAPPSYMEALGGAGATGWDWVIRSFELARKHFPKSELILNDYQILVLEPFTNDYLAIITLLQERGLIDGIGLQAHFLEQAEIAVVEQNLATLAATGLPIYITELDVNFTDDARHANRLKDLVTVFFNNPSVVGLTHWGHLEGDTWRPESYLIRQDGTTRPGMDWLLCAYAGEQDCTVPEYVPSGWQGSEAGLVLEAELFDEARGILASGNSVSYTDQGDWMRFASVSFEESWETLAVTYAKGSEDVGSISVHLDDLDSAALVEIDLGPTGGWDVSETIEIPWAPVSGTHDVFVRFNHVYGVGNVDSIRFSGAAVEPEPTANLVRNSGFEVNTEGWSAWYNSPTLSVDASLAHSGAQSLRVSNRTSGNGDNARYLLTDVVVPGTTYAVSAWATVGGTAVDTARLSAVVQCSNPPAGHNAFPWIQNNSNVTPGEWVQLSGALTIPDCDLTEVAIYIEGTSAGVDVFIDDVEVVPPGGNLIQNAGFESGTGGWSPWYLNPTLTTTTDLAYSGNQCLLITNRTSGGGDNARYVLTDVITPGTTYTASAWVTIGGTQTDTVRLSGIVQCSNPPAGHNAFPWIHNNSAVVAGEWVQLSGTLAVPDCDVTEASIYIEGAAAGTDVYVDEVYFGR